MQHFRSNLTRLRSLMEQKLPDGNDIYGYPGVTKSSLLTALDAAYALSQEIHENVDSRFEVISLKRAGSNLHKSLKDFLDASTTDQENRVRFNEFLDNLSLLVEKTKITYFIVTKNGIRDDEELARIRATITSLTTLAGELKEQKDTITSDIETVSTAIDEIKTNHKATGELTEQINKWHDTSQEYYSEMEETHTAIAGWDEDIQKRNEQFQTLSKQITELAANDAQNRDKLRGYVTTGEQETESLKKTVEEHRKLLDEIRGTLGDANRVSMAASFK